MKPLAAFGTRWLRRDVIERSRILHVTRRFRHFYARKLALGYQERARERAEREYLNRKYGSVVHDPPAVNDVV